MTKNLENLEKKIAKMSFEQAMVRLEEVVEMLSADNIDLDKMIELYQEGEMLKKHCQTRLDEAKMKVEIVGGRKD